MTLDDLAQQVFDANMALPRNGLVAWTSGNASAIDRDAGVVAIKPSGVLYDELTVESIVFVSLQDGRVVRGDLRPSVDTETHLHLYRQDPSIGAVIHTHSVYATAWAATGTPIPPCLTAIADNFDGPVPCGDYVEIGADRTAREVLRVRGNSPAVLMRNHGVFCAAPTLRATLRAAIMVEEVAKTMIMAKIVGTPTELAADEVHRQYQWSIDEGGQR